MRIRQTWWALVFRPARTFGLIYEEASLRRGWLGYAFLIGCIWLAVILSHWILILFAKYRGDRAFATSITPSLGYYAKSFLWAEGLGFLWLILATTIFYFCLRMLGGRCSFRRFATAYAWAYSGGSLVSVLLGLLFWPVIIGFILNNEGPAFIWVMGLSVLYACLAVGVGLRFSYLVARIATGLSIRNILTAIAVSFIVVLAVFPLLLRAIPYIKIWVRTWL